MALPESSVSVACRSLADFVRESFRLQGQTVRVPIGTPAAAAPATGDTDHRVNLFFHRFEPPPMGADVLPGQTWFLRVHCLVTAFAAAEDTVSAGENDLRLLGEVIRFFHEKPVMDALDASGEVVRLQLIFQPLSLDDINRLWSTQKDVVYRPSVAYEVALVPVVPRTRTREAPRVVSVGAHVQPRTQRGPVPAVPAWTPPLARLRVDPRLEDWAPQVGFVRAGTCTQSLVFEVGSPELAGFTPEVVVAGAAGASVHFRWDVWDQTLGWRTVDTAVDMTPAVLEVDPEQPPATSRVPVPLPFSDHAGQAVLYAVRRYRRAADGPEGVELEARGNPVFVTLHGGGA
ncbi:DUF4255 domain-containing protein [Corallococcus exiguus]|uniref:DUF4255 domain-containing protein n=1 Tax=Corallococcus TaxID=83461 RepID=UPI000F879888|nr:MULTISPECIES: DUF4255 domain-containing protein [Corallococcus]NNC21125.1 DUF4255 domain-containing protein [Corallococcus exiguus]RUO87706.1 DUF4255 domain-containing protein [Corallococcus sp. AB018]